MSASARHTWDELEALRRWQREACDELLDIRSQFGDQYLWEKHNERFVVDLLQRAGRDVPPVPA